MVMVFPRAATWPLTVRLRVPKSNVQVGSVTVSVPSIVQLEAVQQAAFAMTAAASHADTLHTASARAAAPDVADGVVLRDEARRARTWRYAWSGVNAGLMLGSFAVLPFASREDRPDWIVSGAGSGLTLVATWFLPLQVESAAEDYDALSSAERAERGPRLLAESAADERDRVRWPWHVANVGLAALGGGIIAFGYRHYLSGAVTAGVGAGLGEAQLFTQPTGLSRAEANAGRWLPRVAFTPARGHDVARWMLSVSGNF